MTALPPLMDRPKRRQSPKLGETDKDQTAGAPAPEPRNEAAALDVPSGMGLPPISPKAAPFLDNPEAEAFYGRALDELLKLGTPFFVAGTYAVSAYTGISRQTKDLDIFCKAGDFLHILNHFNDMGYRIQVEDERWIGKVFDDKAFFDVIFASSNGTMPIGEQWFEHARHGQVLGKPAMLIGPTELVWSKCFIQNRDRFDGADVAHLILKAHDQIDWRRLLDYMEVHWEVLLIHLLNFRWVYPTERDKVPDWLLDNLLERVARQRNLPPSQMKVCRGRMLSRRDYEIDVKEWGFGDISGESKPIDD